MNFMNGQAQVVKEIEEIKARLISVEMHFLESEEASPEDKAAVEEALKEYRLKKTTPPLSSRMRFLAARSAK